MVFDVISPTTLLTVDCDPGSAGVVQVNLLDSLGSPVPGFPPAMANVAAPGLQTIAVNFLNIPPGTGYRLDATGSTVTTLYRNTAGAVYPYTAPTGQMAITGPINALAGFYYFFYNWSIAPPSADDVGVTAVVSPAGSFCAGTYSATVTITNFGTNTQTSIPVSYDVNGGTPVNETWTGSLATGSSVSHTFAVPANLSTPGPYTITAYTTLPGDAFPGNDGTIASVTAFACPYPGTSGGDLELATGVNGAPTGGFGNFTKTATALDAISLNVLSPMGTYDFQPFVLLAQPFATGTPPTPTLPGLGVWLDLSSPFVILIDLDPFLTQFLNPGGTTYTFIMPPGFVGQSFLFQAAGVVPALSLTDGYDIDVL